MDKIKITRSVKFGGKLGRIQAPVTDVIRKRFPDSKVDLIPLPNGFAGISVEWAGFQGQDVTSRQQSVRTVIDRIDPGVPKLIPMIIALTPDEANDVSEL